MQPLTSKDEFVHSPAYQPNISTDTTIIDRFRVPIFIGALLFFIPSLIQLRDYTIGVFVSNSAKDVLVEFGIIDIYPTLILSLFAVLGALLAATVASIATSVAKFLYSRLTPISNFKLTDVDAEYPLSSYSFNGYTSANRRNGDTGGVNGRSEHTLELRTAGDETTESFQSYYDYIQYNFLVLAEKADKKASILLDRGREYAAMGIAFYVVSIFAVQVGFIYFPKDTGLYVAVASTSFLFVFIEFISAWHLRQYRHFTDTSSYLLKVRAIFDRYMLNYLAIHDPYHKDQDMLRPNLVSMLSADIRWPDIGIYTKSDISFAKEALEAVSVMVRSLNQESSKSDSGGKKKDDEN